MYYNSLGGRVSRARFKEMYNAFRNRQELIKAGLRISVGHSDANASQIRQAADQGVTGVTHLFNAMSQLTARAPGVVGAALDDERLFAGMICDGLHVDPLSLRLAFRCKGPDRCWMRLCNGPCRPLIW